MNIVSGTFNDDWRCLAPGDMVISSTQFYVSWPPDGTRYVVSGSSRFWPPYKSVAINPGEPFLLIAHKNRESIGAGKWYRTTWSLIYFNECIWWAGTHTSGSLAV